MTKAIKHVIFHLVFLVMLDFATNSKTRVKYKVSDFQFDIIRDLVYASKFRKHTCSNVSNANSFEYSTSLLSVQKHNIVEIINRELNLFGCCCCCCCLLLFNKRGDKVGFPLANFLARNDLFPLSVSLITSARRIKMDVDKGKRSLNSFSTGRFRITFRFARKNSLVENRLNRGYNKTHVNVLLL